MKLNNKGFAITGILYGLLILFALLVGSYLTILTARKNRLDGIVENIENEYNSDVPSGSKTIEDPDGRTMSTLNYTMDGDSTCIFSIYSEAFGLKDCVVEINKGVELSFDGDTDRTIKANGKTIEFEDGDCDQANAFGNFRYITKLVINYK
ncbi:MAG: hypothetical protein PUH43_00910 [Clostridium sp.]|nr:hypothetical protein [Clostridium sp.]